MNKNLLKAEIVKNGLTQSIVAKELGISEATFTRKMRKGIFGTDEVEKMIRLLHIRNPIEIFLSNE